MSSRMSIRPAAISPAPYFQYLIGVLRLKASIGALTDQDVEDLNRQLKG